MSKTAAADVVLAFVASVAIAISSWQLLAPLQALEVSRTTLASTPVTVFRPEGSEPAPAVVIAHGFAGSQQLMQPLAVALAEHGYVAVTFDFLGHGRNPDPLTGDITSETGATRALVEELAKVSAFARDLDASDGRLAVLGHSMASDIVVRHAKDDPDVAATIAVSMFSPAVTADQPENLLIVVGALEAGLKAEALRTIALTGVQNPVEATTYGSFENGSARRVVFADGVEHIGVLYSEESAREAAAWLNRVFGRPVGPFTGGRGPWLALLFTGIILLARPVFRLLPRVAEVPQGAGLTWRRLLPLAVLPAVATPVILWLVPVSFLPVLVADYLVAHFALYGLLTAVGLWSCDALAWPAEVSLARLGFAASAVALYGILAIGLPLDTFVMSFVPGPARWVLVAAMLIGTLLYFASDEWLTRGGHQPAASYALTKLCFLVSLAIAVALDLERLFFLIIIVPAIVVFFVIFGLLSHWAYRRTRHPVVGGLANAVIFAWAIATTFPMLSG